MGGCYSASDEESNGIFGKGQQLHTVSGANKFNQGMFQIEVMKSDKYCVKEILYLMLLGKYQEYLREQEIYNKLIEKEQASANGVVILHIVVWFMSACLSLWGWILTVEEGGNK